MKKALVVLNWIIESLVLFGLICIVTGGLMATVAVYLLTADKFGPLWPSVVLVSMYVVAVLATWYVYRGKKVKKHEVPRTSRDNTKPSSGSSVVKLDDVTVATAIREAKQRDRYPGEPLDKP